MSFAELGLSPEILRAVDALGYSSPTPIQRKAIPLVLAGHDLLAAAQTGTGKTAAFTLPMLETLLRHANTSASPAMHPVRALILTPTRELADQVAASVRDYSQFLSLRHTVVFGGIAIDPQKNALRRGVEILVATPGRLLDHVEQKSAQLNRVEFLVLDEADRMLDMGFIQDIRRILGLLPKNRQTLLFSATFSPEIKRLSADFMREPQLVEVARQNATNAHIEQTVYAVDAYRKRAFLVNLIRERAMQQVIVFCRTKQGADQLTRELKRDGVAADAIHGDKAQSARLESLAAFKRGEVTVLVATDIAARGLDITELPFVVNFELPNAPEDYVHRIGRTGRAGSSGAAISLMSETEQRQLEAIAKLTQQTLTPEVMVGFWPSWMPRPGHESIPEPSPRPSATQRTRTPAATTRQTQPMAAIVAAPGTLTSKAEAVAKSPERIAPTFTSRPSLRSTREIPALLLPPKYTR